MRRVAMQRASSAARGLAVLPICALLVAGCAPEERAIAPRGLCISCHEQDRKVPQMPDHLTTGFPTSCETCHTEVAWKPANFNHDKFPLVGGHANRACKDCHDKNPVPTTCVGCHEKDRSRPVSPSHLAATFPTTCDTCHTVYAWKPAAFDHSKFPLTGKHSAVMCSSCHPGGDTSIPLSSACESCHLKDRPQGGFVDHFGAGFPTDCASCHTVNGWKPATFDHANHFPIASGKHKLACSSCHTDPKSAKVVSCIDCHEHSKARMDDKHLGENGYSWTTAACLKCHPDGRVP